MQNLDTEKIYDCIVIGAGQAGLSAGYFLKKKGLDFLIIEKASEVGFSWRNRYDSLILFTPNEYCRLPGAELPGQKDAHSTKDEIAFYIQKYAKDQKLPVLLGREVLEIKYVENLYIVSVLNQTNSVILGGKNDSENYKEIYKVKSVILASGPFQEPFIPHFPGADLSETFQIHSAHYKNPTHVKGKKILVVGGGNSGAQIAEELATFANKENSREGNNKKFEVYFSVKGHLSFMPPKIFGKSIFWWMEKFHLLYAPKNSLRARLLNRSEPVIGTNLKKLIKNGYVKLLPEFTGGSNVFDTIIWATGYRQNYSFLKIPNVLNENGNLKHEDGVVENQPGLYCIGHIWQRTRSSALVGGVGRDAKEIVDHLDIFLSKKSDRY